MLGLHGHDPDDVRDMSWRDVQLMLTIHMNQTMQGQYHG